MTANLGVAAFVWVMVIGAVSGVLSMLVFRRWSNFDRLRTAANLVIAHLLEIELFADEPRLVIRAQRDLIAANGRILFHLLRPTLILLLPFAVILSLAESFFGHSPLRPGATALITVQFRNPQTDAQITVPSGIKLDSPPVFIPVDRQVVWRVRAINPVSSNLLLSVSGSNVQKRIVASDGLAWAPSTRGHLPIIGEWPLAEREIESIDIGYQSATIYHLSWLIWFSLSSLIAAGLYGMIL